MFYSFELEKFLEGLVPDADPLLREMEREALVETIPIVTPAVGHFLALLVRLTNAQRILEIGTGTGYSTLWLARAARETGGKVTTIDLNKDRRRRALEYFRRAGLADRIESLAGDAREILPRFALPFDFVFIDAAKGEYEEYFTLVKPLLAPRGLLVVDNVLFRGWVVPGSVFDSKYDRMVSRMRSFLDRLTQDPDFHTSVLPFGDGLALSMRLRP